MIDPLWDLLINNHYGVIKWWLLKWKSSDTKKKKWAQPLLMLKFDGARPLLGVIV